MKRRLSGSKTTSSAAVMETTVTNERKIAIATEGLSSRCFNLLRNWVLPANEENALTICDYISSLNLEINPSECYRQNTIITLCNFSLFIKNANAKSKLFKDVTREDVLSFLDSFRKIESIDPLHKWIGTYNLYRIQLIRFFKWLYSPNIEQKKRPKPSIIENVPQLKEKSIYKPTG
jgi:hypothetical protein